MTNRGRQEGGSATVLVVALGAVIVILGLLVADVATFVSARTQAQLAADAAALAAAPVTFRPFGARGSPQTEAARLAGANGAELIECECERDPTWRSRTVTVRVEVSLSMVLLGVATAGASSRADFDPTLMSR